MAASFVDELRATIDLGRSFGRHPLWLRIAAGRAPRAAQFFL